MIAALLMALTSLLSCSIAAEAHQINLTNARVVVGPDRMVDVEIAMKGSDADRVGGTRVVDETAGLVEPTALAASSAPIVAYVEGHTAVLGENGDACSPGAGSVAPDGDGVVVRILWSCAGVADPLRYRSTVLVDVSPDARQVVLIGTGPDAAQDLLDAGRDETTLTAAPPPTLFQVIERYTGAGIEHIFLGFGARGETLDQLGDLHAESIGSRACRTDRHAGRRLAVDGNAVHEMVPFRPDARKSGSHMTQRWRGMDSNPRSPVRERTVFETAADLRSTPVTSQCRPSPT